MKMKLNKHVLLTAIACTAGLTLAAGSVDAAPVTIYSEDFSGPASNTSVSAVGWEAYENDGTNLTSSTVDPVSINAGSDMIFIGSGPTSINGEQYALISAAGTIDPTDYENDLSISFTNSATDDAPADADTMGWRILATVGTTIYASDFFSRDLTVTTRSLTVSNAVWRVWTGETDLSDGFNIANISGTAGNLAAGNISDIGILAIDGDNNNDRMRLFDFSITGTLVPEPGSLALLGIGGLLIARRRRG